MFVGLASFLWSGDNGAQDKTFNKTFDKTFDSFWKARNPKARAGAVKKIIKNRPAFDDIYKRLRQGRGFPAKVKTGRIVDSYLGKGGKRFYYACHVPPIYDASKRYALEFFLHGGVARPTSSKGEKWIANEDILYNDDRIVVFPCSWRDAMWWHEIQLENMDVILERLKQEYNIDENRVTVVGFSDGGTGAYYVAFKHTTPYAAFIPTIGHAAVLSHPLSGADGIMFVANLVNKPLFIVNGAKDNLYPAASVAPYVDLYRRAGCKVEFRPLPDFGHTLRWWRTERDNMERFKKENPRNPYPDRLLWETEDPKKYGRAHWLVITKLGTAKNEAEMEDWNLLEFKNNPQRRQVAFSREGSHGRVELERKGNVVYARTKGVLGFKLLISPEVFDFGKEISVIVNGKSVFSGMVEKDLGVLLGWAAKDNDRTMLFGCEVIVELER